MRYDDYLLKVLRDDCPFCSIKKEYVIERGKHFTVILARAPYIRDHIMIVPNRHLIRMGEITSEEWDTLVLLIEKWMRKVESIHGEANLLLRDGVAKGKLGKSIDHLHFHIVPDVPIYSTNSGGNREIYTDYQLAKETLAFKTKFRGK